MTLGEFRSTISDVPELAVKQSRRLGAAIRLLLFRTRGGLFSKYVSLFAAVVSMALLTSGLLEILFYYQDHRVSLISIQREQAEAAAFKVGQFIKEIESQLGWTIQLPWSDSTLRQRKFDALRLLRQVPPITEFTQIDDRGRQRLHISRLTLDTVDSGVNLSRDPRFLQTMSNTVYYGPVYFRGESEPYITIAITDSRRIAGVSIAEVNLKFVWDVISKIKVGSRGYAYIIDPKGRLIAHPDLSLVLRNLNLSELDQVRAARATQSGTPVEHVLVADNFRGQRVLTAYAPIASLNWMVFVELPIDEAYAPLFNTMGRIGLVLLASLALASVAGTILAHKMTVPIQALRAGAARIGSGDLEQNIRINTGDELETLADQFNDMARKLRESYADLENRVKIRTEELAQSVNELRGLSEVTQAISSTLDLENVLTTIVINAVQLSGADAGAIYVFDETIKRFVLRATQGMNEAMIVALTSEVIDLSEPGIASVIAAQEPVQIPDIREKPSTPVREILAANGFRAVLLSPLTGPDHLLGVLVIRRKKPGLFGQQVIDLLETFAGQSAIAIENARLFQELKEKSQQLENVSEHKSQFLANVSHELRTPLNAIIGYTDLILNNTYGDIAGRLREVLVRVKFNGNDLLDLINDVLDLSKIEAGQLTLSLMDYSMKSVIYNVYSTFERPAMEKQLTFKVELPPDLPTGQGDERRVRQALLNLVGNAIKFTDSGEVSIKVSAADGKFHVSVRDSGPGIDPSDQATIFEAFRQVDSSVTKEKSGTGLGLTIASHIIRLHGGNIEVHSNVGHGATFSFSIPINTKQQARSA